MRGPSGTGPPNAVTARRSSSADSSGRNIGGGTRSSSRRAERPSRNARPSVRIDSGRTSSTSRGTRRRRGRTTGTPSPIRAADRGFVETRRRSNRIELKRRYRYPDWVDRIVAIENKPDLDASAARTLGEQLQHDIALGLADEVWLATRATDEGVEPALLEALPVEVGVLSVSNVGGVPTVEAVWHPRTLAVEASGTRILERPSGGTNDRSAARFEYADPGWKSRKRLEIAERAYERGWRSYADTMRPDCRHFELREPSGPFPWCTFNEREQTAAECSAECPGFEPEPPAWRSKGWPVEGGPGISIKRLLEEKRNRRR